MNDEPKPSKEQHTVGSESNEGLGIADLFDLAGLGEPFRLLLLDAARWRWIAENPRERASLEWLEPDEIGPYIDKEMGSNT